MWFCADNVRGLKLVTEVVECVNIGRRAFCAGRSYTVRSGGLHRSEDVGMSSENMGENPIHRKPKVY